MRQNLLLISLLIFLISPLFGQEESTNKNKFRQLYQELPTPNVYRNASGAPGHLYWQQKADYRPWVSGPRAAQEAAMSCERCTAQCGMHGRTSAVHRC